ncbi:MAG: HD-GYP domain-containing protein [Planctomycetes bacterium]|nr:HD-GYP domain-containing protein [Planctomycetota bacterium]
MLVESTLDANVFSLDAHIEAPSASDRVGERFERLAHRLRKAGLIWAQAEPSCLRFSTADEWLTRLTSGSAWMRRAVDQVITQWNANGCVASIEAIPGCWVLPAGVKVRSDGVSRGLVVAITRDAIGQHGSFQALCQSSGVDFELTRDLLRREPAILRQEIPRLSAMVSLVRPAALRTMSAIPTIEALLRAVETADQSIRGHSERTANLALRLATTCRLNPTDQETARVAGLLHDVGKIGIPTSILQKRGALTLEERALVNMHPEMGKQIVSGLGGLERTVPAVLWHHERWDGAGYPHGLAGEKIPVLARIMSVVDSFDAMRRNRPYCDSMSIEAALLEVQNGAGRQFDPKIAHTFVGLIDREPVLAA